MARRRRVPFAALAGVGVCIGVGVLAIVWARARGRCDYVHPTCGPSEVCALQRANDPRCEPYATDGRVIAAPFAADERFWCSQGPRSLQGRSHSFGHDIFALDLVPATSRASIAVVAPVAGVAYVYDGCASERADDADAHNDSRCGLGYGNHVKIWDGTNIYLLGHLARVIVAPGLVAAGAVVGIAGVSGAAGHRHVHMVVTRPLPGEAQGDLERPGDMGATPVRYQLNVAERGVHRPRWIDELTCGERRAVATEYMR